MGLFKSIFKKSDNVYICYDMENQNTADEMCQVLEANGMECLLKTRDLDNPDNVEQIINAISESSLVVCIFSQHEKQSRWTNNEIDEAFTKGKEIILFNLDGSSLEGALKFFLGNKQGIDASANKKEAYEELVKASLRILKKPIPAQIKLPFSSDKLESATYNFFISYSTRDNDTATDICNRLEDLGYECWIAPRNIKTGSAYADEIVNGLLDSQIFLPIFSKNYQDSRFTQQELEMATSNGKYILPVRVDGSFPEGKMEFILKNVQIINAYPDFDRGFEDLAGMAQKLIDLKVKTKTHISIKSDEKCTIGDSINICGSLKDDNENALKDKEIKIYVDETLKESVKSREDGSYSATIEAEKSGDTSLQANFEGDKEYLNCLSSTDIKVLKMESDISFSATSSTVSPGEVIVLSGSLKSKGMGISASKINIYNNDEIIDTIMTSQTGKFSMIIPTSDDAKEYSLLAVYNGNDKYYPSTSSEVNISVVEAASENEDETDSVKRPFKAYSGSEPYIFVSYAHKDSNLVFPEIKSFHDRGYPIWYDQGLTPGQEWDDEVAEALINCTLLVVFISKNSMASNNVQDEIKLALKRQIDIVPIYFEDTELPPGLELRLSNKHAIFKYNMDRNDYLSECFKAFDKSKIPKISF